MPFLALAVALALACTAARPAKSATDFGPKVSGALTAAATAKGVASTTPLHAIVYGSDLTTANADLGSAMTVRRALGAIGGESVSIPAGSLTALAAEAGA